ncbi:MAG: universal stress protein [Halalkalicoccus sp.]|nr:universal stress protein [Halalkalicoccus sp.]
MTYSDQPQGGHGARQYDAVLAPLDALAVDSGGISAAIDLAVRHGATLHIVSIVDRSGREIGVMPSEILVDLDGVREKDLDRVIAQAERAGVRSVVPSTVHDTFERATLQYAETHDIDLIVLARRKPSTFERLLFGGRSDSIVRNAEMPVLTVSVDDTQRLEPLA